MTLYPRALTVALLAGLLGLPATAQSDRDFDPFDDVDQDELNQSIFYPRHGFYLSGTYGLTQDYTIRSNEIGGTGPGSSQEAFFDFDDDDAVTAALGHYFGNTRAEFELGFRETDIFASRVLGFDEDVSGHLNYFTIMANLFYDIPTPLHQLDFYIGAGIGLALITGNFTFDPPATIFSTDGTSRTTEDYDSTTHHFAYQFMAGASLRVTDHASIFGGYRFRGFTEGNDDTTLLEFREHDVQGIEIGLRIDF